MVTEFHAVGIAYRPGKNRGFVVVRFDVSGDRVLNAELVSPEPEAIHFAAGRLKGACAELLQLVREDVESSVRLPDASAPKDSGS